MGDSEDNIPPTMVVISSRGFKCFKCLDDGNMPLHVLLCGHSAHKECVIRVWHDHNLFLAGKIYCTVCNDTFNIRAVYRKTQSSHHPRRPRCN